MKSSINKIILAITVMLFAFTANAQQVGLTLTPQGTMPYTAGTQFWVYANYNYSNITGNIVISVSYDNSKVSFCGSPAFPTIPTSNTVGTNTTVTYTFPAVAGNNQTGVIMLCFSYLCPSTCFGQNINSTITGTIAAPSNSLTYTAAPAAIIGKVLNTWNGTHSFFSFIQSSYEVTFKLTVQNGNCFTITNPKFTITPSMGTLVSVTNGALVGSTFTPTNTVNFNPGGYYEYYYTIKLPCNTPPGTTITSNVVLQGTNCNINNVNIITYPAASYTLPAVIPSNPSATISSAAYTGYYYVQVYNNGNTPLNLSLANILPTVKTTQIYHYSSQPTGLTATLTYEDCSNTPSTAYPFNPGATNTTPPLYAKKATMAITNLLPGYYCGFYIYYNLSNSCIGVPTATSYTLNSSMSYTCSTAGLSQVCYNCGPGGTGTTTSVYNLSPDINCNWQNSNPNCLSPGDTATFCLQFRNDGTAPLLSGVLNFGLQNFLTYIPGSETFTGFSTNPVYQPASAIKWNLPTIPVGSTTYSICFKAIVNANAPYGSYGMNYSVTGTNYTETQYCSQSVNICALPKAEVEKMVKGDLDAVFGTSGSGTPGSTATYQITVKNTGNTNIGNIVLIDRLPFSGDLTIMNCTSRGSVFSLFPGGTVTIPGATVQYSATPNAGTGWPTTTTSCNIPASTFSGTFAPNNLRIALTNPIAPGGTYTFTFNVVVPANAPIGQLACNTIGMICDFFDNANNASQMNPVESNKVCLEAKTKEIPPSGCCKDFLKKIEVKQDVSNNILSVNTTVTVGPAKLTKASVSLVDFHILHAKDCGDVCVKDPKNMGNITNVNSSFTWNNLPANVTWSHLIQWKDSAGVSWNNGVPLSFQIPLPPKSPISCCCDTIMYCLKYSFTDTACVTCDTIICYKAYNGKDCGTTTTGGGQGDTQCNCSWNPKFNYEGAPQGGKSVSCGGSITVPLGNIPVTFNPGFQCIPSSATCSPSALTVKLVNNATGGTTTLSGPNYSHTFLTPGSYTYNLSGVCGGKKCECSITVNVPGH